MFKNEKKTIIILSLFGLILIGAIFLGRNVVQGNTLNSTEENIDNFNKKEWEDTLSKYLEHIVKTPIVATIQISETEQMYATSNGKGELIAELSNGASGIYKKDYSIVIPSLDKVNVLTDVSPLQQIDLYLNNKDLINTNCYSKDGFVFYEMSITGEENIRKLYKDIPNFSDELIGKYINMLNAAYKEEAGSNNIVDTSKITESIKVISSLDNSSIVVTNDVSVDDKFINIFAISYVIEIDNWQLQEEWYNGEISIDEANTLIQELQINLSSIITESVSEITQEIDNQK